MKINRWVALAAIALLVVGAMGFVSYRVFASTYGSSASQDCGPDTEADDASETAETENADVEECGQEDEVEDGDANEIEEVNGQDTSNEAASANTGITADEAQAVVEKANLGAGTLAVEFDREGGKDIWEVELDNGLDVQVDANSGVILKTDQRD